jgi:hypothetical protein
MDELLATGFSTSAIIRCHCDGQESSRPQLDWLDLNVAPSHFHLAQGLNRNFPTINCVHGQRKSQPILLSVTASNQHCAARMFRFRTFRKCWLGASFWNLLYQKVKNTPLASE